MDSSIAISVVIPTRGRPQRLATCLQRLARQSLPAHHYEVLVGFDGPDDPGDANHMGPGLAAQAWSQAGGDRANLKVVVCPRAGLAAVRNALLPFVQGRVLLSLNDDLLAEPQLLQRHVEAHDTLPAQLGLAPGSPLVVTGDSPWVVREHRTLFDAMLEGTSMIFFYHRMLGDGAPNTPANAPGNPLHDWGFRHAWGLNMSMPTSIVRRVGGFTQFPSWYGYEDNEIVFKVQERMGRCPVLFVPQARGWHDHAMTPREYLTREYKLGYAALGFTRTSPACSKEMFRRDLLCDEEISRCTTIATTSDSLARDLLPWFDGLATTPASLTNTTRESLQLHYDKHLPLKRWAWNAGLHDALQDTLGEAMGRSQDRMHNNTPAPHVVSRTAASAPNLHPALTTGGDISPARLWQALGTTPLPAVSLSHPPQLTMA
jgi:glycosyltransferase involved in cell wall biosynthesis